MNHNQIIHKLPPQFQTNNVAQKHVWLRLWVCLVRKQRVDELAPASIWSARALKIALQNLPEVLSASLPSSLYVFLFPCLWPCLIGLSREIYGLQNFPCLSHIWITRPDIDKDIYAKITRTYKCPHIPVCLIWYLHRVRGWFSLHITSPNSFEYFSKQMMPLSHFLSHLRNIPRRGLLNRSHSLWQPAFSWLAHSPGSVHAQCLLHLSRLRCLFLGVPV